MSGVSSWRQFVTTSIAQVLFTDAEGFIKVDHTDHIIKGYKTIIDNGCSHIIAICMIYDTLDDTLNHSLSPYSSFEHIEPGSV